MKKDVHYIGQTKDLMKRLDVHNSSKARWTKRYQPWEIVYSEVCDTRSEAMKRERFLKTKNDIKEFLNNLDKTRLAESSR